MKLTTPLIWILRKTIGRVVIWKARRAVAAFKQAAAHCLDTQQRVVLEKIARNAESDFGQAHHFQSIGSIDDFRRAVPITTYDYYEPYIERLKRGEVRAMFGSGQKLLMFALTSGTTARQKYIPITDVALKEYKRGWMLWGLHVFDQHRTIFSADSQTLQLASDWEEFRTEGGIPCGSVSGLTAAMHGWIIRRRYCLPPVTVKIKDSLARYYTALRLALPAPIAMAVAPNPSTLITLARLGDEYKETLLRDLADGTLSSRFDIPTSVREALQPRIRRRWRDFVRAMERIVEREGHLYPKHYWQRLTLLANWTGGTVRAYLNDYPEYFGPVPVRDIGLIASEGRMTVPIEDGTPAGVLDILHNFFEFIPEEEIDSPNPTVLLAHELEEGHNYYILITTSTGLYRYDIRDVVRCVGRYLNTPVLEFLHKGAHIANMTGEKLTEHQVVTAVDQAVARLNLRCRTYTLAPIWDRLPYYALLIEHRDLSDRQAAAKLAAEVDSALRHLNAEYDYKRQSLRLGPVRVRLVPNGTWQRLRDQKLAERGGTLEQYKHPCIAATLEFAQHIHTVAEIEPAPASLAERAATG